MPTTAKPTTKRKLPTFNVTLINPIGKHTGVGKMTLGMAAKDKQHAEYSALKYARETYYWCYHLLGWPKPKTEAEAKKELALMREKYGHLPPLDPEPALATLPEGVTYP